MRFLPAGHNGLLVELDSQAAVRALYAELRRRAPPGVTEIVPAARTVLLIGSGLDALKAELPGWSLPPVPEDSGPLIEIPVRYDGPDLTEVAALSGLPVTEVIRLHSTATFTVAFCGFVPGFAYLTGLPAALQLPRRRQPRTRVAPGSVGIAGEYSAIYPRATPGGWQLIGHTDVNVWDAARQPPALLMPGTRVRFVAQPA
ncbi:MAG TPA: allophanate hydrolase subunit 1 [Nevskiales bacterium]|nr:allophanate hydrolase subunit 1 [Nevskiales bacterium]